MGSIPGSGRFPWRRVWQPTPIFLPGESHGPRSLADYSPYGCHITQATWPAPSNGYKRHRRAQHLWPVVGSGLTLSPSKSKWARKITASLMGTSSFLYKIWKTRLCMVLSWTQAECGLPLSAKQEPVEAHERPSCPGSSASWGVSPAQGKQWPQTAFQFPKTKVYRWNDSIMEDLWSPNLRKNILQSFISHKSLVKSLAITWAVLLGWTVKARKC